jgi:hypothetical protein
MTKKKEVIASVKPLNQQQWKMAASGTGAIVCQPTKDGLRVLLSERAANVGPGRGITGGGFVECGEVLALKLGTVIQTADEAFRECCQENGGFENVINIDAFLERAQPVSLVHARTDDLNEVHAVTMFALTVNNREWNEFAALPPGVDEHGKIERNGPLLEYFVRWTGPINRREPERYVSISDATGRVLYITDFFHPHEFHTIAAIAWYEQNGKLWRV